MLIPDTGVIGPDIGSETVARDCGAAPVGAGVGWLRAAVSPEIPFWRGYKGLKPASIIDGLRGAEAPLFHVGAGLPEWPEEVLIESRGRVKVKGKVKGSGRECPLHTSLSR